MSAALQKANDPATVGAVPGLGSTSSGEDGKMNEATNTTAATSAPARSKPTDKQIVAAMDDIMADVCFLHRAAVVLEEYATFEFRAGIDHRPDSMFDYGMNKSQIDGILYMAMHVRDLAEGVEKAFDKAFGLEG